MKWTNKGHELDSVADRLAPKKYLYIYGAGENGKYITFAAKDRKA